MTIKIKIYEGLIIGATMGFVPDGTIVDGNPTGRLVRPEADCPGKEFWGLVKTFDPQSERTNIAVQGFDPDAGKYNKTEYPRVDKSKILLSLDHIAAPVIALNLGLKKTDGGKYKPFATNGFVSGWMICTLHDALRDGDPIGTIWVYGNMSTAASLKGSPEPTEAQLEFSVINSPVDNYEWADGIVD